MPRNYEKNAVRIAAILNSLPATQGQLHERTGISQAALARWCVRLLDEKKIHFLRYEKSNHGGPLRPIFLAGPRPAGARIRKPEKLSSAERVAKFRLRMRASGEWEDILAKRRARNALRRKPKQHPLMQAFYGASA